MNELDALQRTLDALQRTLSVKSDALAASAGTLIDADIPKADALLVASQIRQQLATQSLGLSNQMPQLLLQLFR